MKIKFPYYTKSQRQAIFLLVAVVIALQIGLYFLRNPKPIQLDINQTEMSRVERELDSLAKAREFVLTAFNPNFITDYRGYVLEMSKDEIDRLHRFREQDKYVNSAQEFQQITGVSDEWLNKYQAYFKFPDFTHSDKRKNETKIIRKDINTVSYEDLVAINGIGDYSAQKIISERENFGGFVSTKQFRMIENLPANVYLVLEKNFQIGTKPNIQKIDINRANINDLQQIPYINYRVARSIVVYRSKQDNLIQEKDLQDIPNFPLDKLEIISLYLGTSK